MPARPPKRHESTAPLSWARCGGPARLDSRRPRRLASGGEDVEVRVSPAEEARSSPATIRVTTGQGELVYERADELIAVHRKGGAGPPSIEPAGAPRRDAGPDASLGPVYRRRPGGDAVVPTGRAFVRFPEGESAERHREVLAAAGFELEDVPAYAPHAAWVRAHDGSVSAALHGLGALARLPGVQHVEPQLVGQAARRGGADRGAARPGPPPARRR